MIELLFLFLYYFIMTVVDLIIVEFSMKPLWKIGKYLYENMRWYYYSIWGVISILFFALFIKADMIILIPLVLLGGLMAVEDVMYWILRAPFYWIFKRDLFMSKEMQSTLPKFDPETNEPLYDVKWFWIPEKLPWMKTITSKIDNYLLLILSGSRTEVKRRGVITGCILYIIGVSIYFLHKVGYM